MSAAPTNPASGPSAAATIERLRAVAAADERARERLPGRPEQQLAGVRDPAADDDRARVERRGHPGQPDAEPAADVGEQLDGERVAVPRGLGDQRAGQPGRRRRRPGRAGRGPPASRRSTSSRASRTSALPEAYCSQQPRLPHSQRWPSGTTCMWPNSPAIPLAPRNTRLSMTSAPPMPVPRVMHRT